ncbi:ImmA/IrrE family metallo-endopeptidase [Leptospira levettii]|uniref:ImmA/IrrE family metallo-endopeptidase n=1 Tax=Leptospira levettii TaxID=2023178 RepID=UPI001083A3B1|nr:ImmA/IrrE family metallo-endopeptidase [Leptospira levettii]TGM31418.1 ImmA/IrrE family metallo-endopeptidase [Leptospira levettii]
MKLQNEKQYKDALARVEVLMDKLTLNKKESKELDQLANSIEIYEESEYPIEPPDPIEAIRFRMEQKGLKNKDLIPFIGSKSKVSEVLNGRRNLSQEMVKKLNQGLGIPLNVLMGTGPNEKKLPKVKLDWEKFPISEMFQKKWIPKSAGFVKNSESIKNTLESFFSGTLKTNSFDPLFLRSTWGEDKKANPYAIKAWQWMVLKKASEEKLKEKFQFQYITNDFRRDLAKLSYLNKGPILAKEYLNKIGIHLVVLEHLKQTYLDGAAMMSLDGRPVIAMTLRYDRLDNFWFVLFHELAHIALHLKQDAKKEYLEDFDHLGNDQDEAEANDWAAESLIPSDVWNLLHLTQRSSTEEILQFAKTLRIHPSILAGRIRRETQNYTLLPTIIKASKVRQHFVKLGNS